MVSAQDLSGLSPSTIALHADQRLNNVTDVTPPIHVSTTFRYPENPTLSKTVHDLEYLSETPEGNRNHIYSRESNNSTTRLELLLSTLIGGPTITYASGLSAFHALLILLNPKRIAIGPGYHGCKGVLAIFQRLTGATQLDLLDEGMWKKLQPGDLVHVETPMNPFGTALNLEEFAAKAHAKGAIVSVDATFAPPGLFDPFTWGADVIMHSGTKYFGGHSDLLCGTLSVKGERKDWVAQLKQDRTFVGSVMGGLESWLAVRSLRTLEVRVQRQSESAGRLVAWIDGAMKGREDADAVSAVVDSLTHASLQKEDMEWLSKQMPNGYGPVFSITMKTVEMARRLPDRLLLLHHATSLGGVESLIEWRAMSDAEIDPRLLRVSIGLENWEDLKRDFLQAFKALAVEVKEE